MAKDSKLKEEAGQKRREVALPIKALVLFHVFAIFSWSLPDPPQSLTRMEPSAAHVARYPLDYLYYANHKLRWGDSGYRYYLFYTGGWQAWNMFSPNPSQFDAYYDAEITYLDGTKEIVPYPRMYTMTLTEKYLKERFRKYSERFNNEKTESWKWPALAQWMAHISYHDPNNPPTVVVMRRHWRFVQAMDKPQQSTYNHYSFYRHVVDRKLLVENKRLEK